MVAVSVTTDVNRLYLPMDFFITNTSLRINNQSPFTVHYGMWPFVGLISLMALVWLLVYISTILARRNHKADQRNFSSLYVTQNSTAVASYEASTALSPTNV